jgi:hypothetical protein
VTNEIPREQSSSVGLLHPEWVDGRRLWMDTVMRDIIHKLHHGDPVKGWEGDPNLAVYWNGEAELWELWRLEHDGEYRMVCRSTPGTPFDDRLIDAHFKVAVVRNIDEALNAARAWGLPLRISA